MSRRAATRVGICVLGFAAFWGSSAVSHAATLGPGGTPTGSDPTLRLWLDSSDLATLFQDSAATTPVTANGQPVGRWNDKSTLGLNVSQPTAINRPTYRASVGNLANKPALGFVGGASSLLAASNLTGIDGNEDRTIITVWSNAVNNGANYQHTFHMGTDAGNQAYGHSAFRGSNSRIGNHYWGDGFDTTVNGSGSATYAVSIWDGDGGTPSTNGLDSWFVNGAAAGSSNRAALATGVNQLLVGSRLTGPSEGITGDIAEVIVYNTAITPAERLALEGYLNAKYVPEPSTALLAGFGLLGLLGRRRRVG